MKAWRLEAAAINARRKAGSREPTARVQKEQRMAMPKLRGASNWLLSGLMVHAGFWVIPSAPGFTQLEPYIPQTEGFARRLVNRLKKWWNK